MTTIIQKSRTILFNFKSKRATWSMENVSLYLKDFLLISFANSYFQQKFVVFEKPGPMSEKQKISKSSKLRPFHEFSLTFCKEYPLIIALKTVPWFLKILFLYWVIDKRPMDLSTPLSVALSSQDWLINFFWFFALS